MFFAVFAVIGGAAAIDINSSTALQYHFGTDRLFEVGTAGTITAYGDLDMRSGAVNNITNFFGSECSSGQVVSQVFANGLYKCTQVSTEAEGLADTLAAGNFSDGQDIYLNGSTSLRFDAGIRIGDAATSAAADQVAIGNGASASASGAVAIGR